MEEMDIEKARNTGVEKPQNSFWQVKKESEAQEKAQSINMLDEENLAKILLGMISDMGFDAPLEDVEAMIKEYLKL